MNLKILFMLLVYWSVWLLIITSAYTSVLSDDNVTTTVSLNNSEFGANETVSAGLFSSGLSFSRWFSLAFFGIGLGTSTPVWFSVLFSAWQTIVSVFTIGFVISSIWNG